MQCFSKQTFMLHQKRWSKRLSGVKGAYYANKDALTWKKSPIGKNFKSPLPKDRREGLRILLKTSVRGEGELYCKQKLWRTKQTKNALLIAIEYVCLSGQQRRDFTQVIKKKQNWKPYWTLRSIIKSDFKSSS